MNKICKQIGCPNFSNQKHGYCTTHQHQATNKGFGRKTERNPIYDTTRWKKLRKYIIQRQPICSICKRKASNTVHHIKEARLHPELAFDPTNLEALCTVCHNRESQKESTKTRKTFYA